jgi:hypothetical protein
MASRICNITEEPEIRLVPEHAGLRAGVRLQPLNSSRQAYVIVSFSLFRLFFALSFLARGIGRAVRVRAARMSSHA